MKTRLMNAFLGMVCSALMASGCQGGGGRSEEERPTATPVDHSDEARASLRAIYDQVVAYFQAEHVLDPSAIVARVEAWSSNPEDRLTVAISGTNPAGQPASTEIRLDGTNRVGSLESFTTITAIRLSGLPLGQISFANTERDESIGDVSNYNTAPLAPGPLTLDGYDAAGTVVLTGLDATGQAVEETVTMAGQPMTSRQSFSRVLDVRNNTTNSVSVSDAAGASLFYLSAGTAATDELSMYGLPFDARAAVSGPETMWLPPSVARTPAEIPCGQAAAPNPADWQAPTWDAFRFSFSEPHYYSYQFDSSGHGLDATFSIYAFGDIDCDGVLSTFSRTGTAMLVPGEYGGSEPGFRGASDTSSVNPEE